MEALELAKLSRNRPWRNGKSSVQLTENKAETGTLPARPRPFGNDLFFVRSVFFIVPQKATRPMPLGTTQPIRPWSELGPRRRDQATRRANIPSATEGPSRFGRLSQLRCGSRRRRRSLTPRSLAGVRHMLWRSCLWLLPPLRNPSQVSLVARKMNVVFSKTEPPLLVGDRLMTCHADFLHDSLKLAVEPLHCSRDVEGKPVLIGCSLE